MKHYKIKDFCQHMGVSQDTVKHYQNCGILKPHVDTKNNYRYYNITHGERLIVSRRFRNLGFSIEDTVNLISCLSGSAIQEMLSRREREIEEQLAKLYKDYENLRHMNELCELFNHHANTYQQEIRPAYFFHRHTCNNEFLEPSGNPAITKKLMEQLPNAVKLLVVPYDTICQRINKNYYHGIGIKESLSLELSKESLLALEYYEECPCIRYIYSRPHSKDKIKVFDDIRQELISHGFCLCQKDILIENGIDYYVDGVRYENYLIYYPYEKTSA